ncbi:MAG: FeoC-like transcriptional regulator [Candidatus Dasytiphilus stammeri]
MVSVMDVYQKLALLGRADARQLSLQLCCTSNLALIEAILDTLVRIGKITRIQLPKNDFCSTTCNTICSSKKQQCYCIIYQLS